MGIDGRSEIGQILDVDNPIMLDLKQLGARAADHLAKKVRHGDIVPDAVISTLEFAGRLAMPDVVAINLGKLKDKKPEIDEALTMLQDEEKLSLGSALGTLIFRGAKATLNPGEVQVEKKEEGLGAQFGGILDDLFGGR